MSDEGDEEKEKGNNLTVMTGSAIAPPRPPSAKVIEAEKLRNRVAELRDRMTEDYFEIGRLLYYIQQRGIYRLWEGPDKKPYETFSDYVEHEVAFKYRKAKYLMGIWWWFGEKLDDPAVFDQVKSIGWTKAAALVGVVDEKNVVQWVEKATELKVKELESEVRVALEKAGRKRPTIDVQTKAGPGHIEQGTLFGGGKEKKPTPPASSKLDAIAEGRDTQKTDAVATGDSIKTTLDGMPATAAVSHPAPLSGAPETIRQGVDPLSDGEVRLHRTIWRVMMDGEQQKNVDLAIDMASKIAGVENDGKGYLLDLIATQFLSFFNTMSPHNDRSHEETFRADVLKAVERAFGIDIVALERGTVKPVYGGEILARAEAEEAEEN